jgi:hypothetical protein
MKSSFRLVALALVMLAASWSRAVVAAPVGWRTLLKVNMVRGFVTVFVNGQRVGRYGKSGTLDRSAMALATRDISALVRPGANTLRAEWSEQRFPTGEVHVSFAARSGPGAAFRELASFDFGVASRAKGNRSATFNLPDAAGRLSSALGTAGNAGRRVQSNSRDSQTLLVANIVRGKIAVWVNGRKVGDYPPGLVRLDISNFVRGGANTVRLAWDEDAAPIGGVRISYAPQRNRFRTVTDYDLSVFAKRRANTGTIAFTLPRAASA